jgi:hypothetical protein
VTLALAQVVDIDYVLSFRPLVFGMPSTERYATGGDAIVRRILYSWARNGGLLELPGRTLDDEDLAQIRAQLSALAEAEDFVESITLDLELDDVTSTLTIAAAEVLIDGQTYPLEVATADAAAAIAALGSATP